MSSVNWEGVGAIVIAATVVALMTLLAGPIGFIFGLFAGIGVIILVIKLRDSRLELQELSQNVSALEDRVERLEDELQISRGEKESADEGST